MHAIKRTLALMLCALLLLAALPEAAFAHGGAQAQDDEALWSIYWKRYDAAHPEQAEEPDAGQVEKKAAQVTTLAEMLARAEALVNYTWTPTTDIYTWNGARYNGKPYFPAGSTVTGMPYTLFAYELVPISLLSLEQYRAVASVNYSTTAYCTSVGAYRTGPVYGSCCADLVSEVFGGDFMRDGGPRYHSVYRVRTSPYGTAYYDQKMEDIRPGDALSDMNDDHIIWVGDVTDTTITIYEQTPPAARKRVLDKDRFTNDAGYFVYNTKAYSTITRSNAYVNEAEIRIEAEGGSTVAAPFTVTLGDTFRLDPGDVSRDGYALQGWHLHRPADDKWFVAGLGWYTEEEIGRGGYKKHVYLPGLNARLDASWFDGVGAAASCFSFHAVWRRDYTVSVDPNGGTATVPGYSVRMGERCVLDPSYAEKDGCTLLGWTLRRPSDGKWYVAGQGWYPEYEIRKQGMEKKLYRPADEEILTGAWLENAYSTQIDRFVFVAQWETRRTVELRFDASGGEGPTDPAAVTVGEAYGALPTPARPQFTFAGWYTAEGERVTEYTPVSISEDHTLYAHWIEDCAEGHDWDEGVVRAEPTEASPGLLLRTCTRCGQTLDEALAPLPHTHSFSETQIAPSCAMPGFTLRVCGCGYSELADTAAPLGHDYRTEVTPPTCVLRGYHIYTCARCGDRYSKNDLEPQGHDYAAGFCRRCGGADPDYVPPFRFDDVRDESRFYFSAVYWAYEAEPQITNGLDGTRFSPDAGCTRGQTVTFLWRAAGCPEPAAADDPFTDVPEGAFYHKAVAWAVEQGITRGVSQDCFAPDQICTRGQIVTFLWRFRGKPDPAGAGSGFPDVDAGSFCADAVAWAVDNQITNGMSAAAFGPNAPCTRGQIVTFLQRVFGE